MISFGSSKAGRYDLRHYNRAYYLSRRAKKLEARLQQEKEFREWAFKELKKPHE